MKPSYIHTKIFLDSGDPAETEEAVELLGFLDGQTTNPTLVAKNPYAKERFEKGEKFTADELLGLYKRVVTDVSRLVPDGSVSIEVYADAKTKSEDMLQQARIFFSWIPNAHIKFPTTEAGLTAASEAIKEGLRVNMTLCFSQAQAAAVYAATRGAQKGRVFISPFVGRLDDMGQNGMDLIANIEKMYRPGDGHVEILAASIRSYEHFMCSLALGADIITAPLALLKDWQGKGFELPNADYRYNQKALWTIKYEMIDMSGDWHRFNLHHELTDKGLKKFADDWNALLR